MTLPEDDERGPQRTCVACRESGDRDALVRLVADPTASPQKIIVDYRARAPGRGAWVHPTATCVSAVEARPGMAGRVLGVQPLVAEGLLTNLRDQVMRAVADGLSMAQASGALVGGHDVLIHGINDGIVIEIVVASDASDRTIGDLRAAVEGSAHPNVPFTRIPMDRETLGTRIGRGSRAAVGIKASRATAHLRRQLHRLRALG